MNKYLYIIMFCISLNANAISSGAWTGYSTITPPITNYNVFQYQVIKPVGTILSSAVVSTVNYSFSLNNIPTGLTISLCSSPTITLLYTATCYDATHYFSNSNLNTFVGLPANNYIILSYAVNSFNSGNLIPNLYVSGLSVTVNYTIPNVNVPDVVGLSKTIAEANIVSSNLTVGTITTQNSTTIAASNVISETPTAGTSVNNGSTVSLIISSGAPLSPTPIPMPTITLFILGIVLIAIIKKFN